MNSVSDISNSALSAYAIRQAVTANNVANVQTEDFKASRAINSEKPNGGVSVRVEKTEDRVDISREAVNMMSNSSSFKANTKAIKANDEMTRELLNIKA